MSKWDKGVDFETAYRAILSKIRSVKRDSTRCYLIVALIQLRNGARVSEAIRAFKEWIKTSKSELYIKVSKKKRVEYRLMIIPDEVEPFRLACIDLLDVDDRALRERVRATLHYYLKLNTHTLRYSFITHLLKQGVNPAIVSKAIRHSRLDTLMHYVQIKESDRILREMG